MENNYLDPEYRPQHYRDMSVGDWVGTMILMMIPVVNFICLIVWAVSSSSEKRSRKNWAIATFIIMGISIMLSIVLGVVMYTTFGTMQLY